MSEMGKNAAGPQAAHSASGTEHSNGEASVARPVPGAGEQTKPVTETLDELAGKPFADQIVALERVHSELSNRLNRARL